MPSLRTGDHGGVNGKLRAVPQWETIDYQPASIELVELVEVVEVHVSHKDVHSNTSEGMATPAGTGRQKQKEPEAAEEQNAKRRRCQTELLFGTLQKP